MSEPDAPLVLRARAGDREAYEALVRRHIRLAYTVAIAEAGDAAEADDICQDAFVTALERLEQCREPERFQAWLLRIVRNRARTLRRRASVRAAHPLHAAAGVAGPSSPARDAERAELRGRLATALAELTPVRRSVVLLHDLEGWRHREIAEELGIPEGTVRSHLFHARRALRERLEQAAYQEEADESRTG